MNRTPSPPPQFWSGILGRLNSEWLHITLRAEDLRAVTTWDLPGGPPASLDDLLVRCGYRPHAGAALHAAHDDVLLRVVEIARDHPLAARVALQRILPALCGAARRHSASFHYDGDLLDELVAHTWTVIRTYPVDRRPRRVAANLVQDTRFATIIRPTRRLSARTDLVGIWPESTVERDEVYHRVDSLRELIELVRDARHDDHIDDSDVELMWELITHGRPENVAVIRNCTPRTIRNHRDAVIHRLRSYVADAA